MTVLNVVASVASILGALFAFFQYSKAKKAAESAVNAKNEILFKKTTLDLNSLYLKTKDVDTLLNRYKSKKETQSRGANVQKDILVIEEFVSLLNDKRSLTTSELRIFLDTKYSELTNYSDRVRNGEIQTIISDFSFCVRDLISKLTEKINETTYS